MTELLVFLAIALGMALCVAGVVVWVLLRQGPVVTSASQSQANVKVYREQILDLDREHDNGHLSDAEWQQSRDELSVRLLQDTAQEDDPHVITQAQSWPTAVVIALALPVAAVGLYIWLGAPEALSPMPTPASAAAPEQAAPQNLEQIAENLASKLQAEPNNLEGWVLLGRTYRSMDNLDAALSAFDRALKLSADDELSLARAEVLAAKNQGRFDGKPWRVIREVLQRDPQNYAALLLAGSASYADNRYADALEYWQRARLRLSADHPDVPNLVEAMSTVQGKLKNPARPSSTPAAQGAQGAPSAPAASSAASGTPQANAAVSGTGGAASGLNVSGQVRLSKALKSQTSPADVVFVYAVPANGERMPLALLKTTVAQLPLNFTLDDSSAMLPDRKLSGAGQVLVKARISKSGNAIPQSGDWEGSLGPVKVGSSGLNLEISTQRP